MTGKSHAIIVCTTCREAGSEERPGKALLDQLSGALARDATLSQAFSIAGPECMAGCSRSCTVAFRAEGKATYLFGDMAPDEDVADLLTFAHQYREIEDGWCISKDRPGKLRRTALARIPAIKGPGA
ncbi:DUF1636 family protein [Roseibium sediminis]|uniref:DUF1636 family protein n=1 Tax=Roseibium sediminis TaxID=1775174 RepID=UPI00123CE867|nr:DUF1636 domain-containing protein [Roseibium sediminis]